jgi:isoamylase
MTVSDDRVAPVAVGPSFRVRPGRSHPLGATITPEGTNFALFARDATSVQLLLFERHDSARPFQVVDLDPERNLTVHVWHCEVEGVGDGVAYGYRVDGSRDVSGLGTRFDPGKVLLDPYGRGTSSRRWNRAAACEPGDNVETAMRSVVVDVRGYDWEGDRPLNRPLADSVIYELHVKGLTASATSGVAHPGTYRGVIDKIPYLQSLGVTAVELLPVFEFDPQEFSRINPLTGDRIVNYWGYSPLSFFAPHGGYAVTPGEAETIDEVRDMVKALHRAGIEVILDVVFNHTGEGNHEGPTISFRGIDNRVYYLLEPDRRWYTNISGCGNTFSPNHPVVDKFIVECLRYWVRELHVDGFRFDLASVLSRGQDGRPMADPPVLWHIELDDELADTKLIAEAWDAGGLYQVGRFPGYRWAEWNGRYRDDIRRFVKGDQGLVGVVASRVAGSADLYQGDGEQPINSINFITAHDGFTLSDLVSYNDKHNEANGEDNRDGTDDNASWNHGVEGPTTDPSIAALRDRQVRNYLAILLLSQGVPMLLMGDEARRTQGGNNNAYCQDNEVSWLDWALVARHADLVRFTSELIAFRRRLPNLRRSSWFTGRTNARGLADISWHGTRLLSPGWNDPTSRVLAFTLAGFPGDGDDDLQAHDVDIHVVMNMEWQDLDFELPAVRGRRWVRVMDTGAAAPADIADPGQGTVEPGPAVRVRDRSVVVLVSQP